MQCFQATFDSLHFKKRKHNTLSNNKNILKNEIEKLTRLWLGNNILLKVDILSFYNGLKMAPEHGTCIPRNVPQILVTRFAVFFQETFFKSTFNQG